MILTCLDTVIIKLLEDISQIMRLEVSCLFAMTRLVETTFVKKPLLSKYFSVNFIGLLCLKMLMITVGDALDAKVMSYH